MFYAHFLTEFSVKDEFYCPKSIDYKKIATFFSISKTLDRNMAKMYQKELSIASSEFFLYFLKVQYPEECVNMRRLFVKTKDGLSIFPTYLGAKLLFSLIKVDKISLLILVNQTVSGLLKNQDYFFFRDGLFENIEPYMLKNEEITAIQIIFESNKSDSSLLESKEELLVRINSAGLLDIVLSNFASHPQYVNHGEVDFDRALHDINVNLRNEIFNDYKQYIHLSNIYGYNYDEKGLFLKHVCATSICDSMPA